MAASQRQRGGRKRARRKTSWSWQQLRFYVSLSVLCCVLALLLSILTGRVPEFIERMIVGSVNSIIEDTLSNPTLQR